MTRADAAALKSCCTGLYELPVTRALLGDSFHPGGEKLTRELASLALVHRETRVLDVASGPARSSVVLARGFGCRVTALDLSERNLAATESALEARLRSRVSFVRGDAESLPIRSGAFDVVLCECALCTFPDAESAAREMLRVLAPRGRVALSDVTLEKPVPAELQGVIGAALCIAGARSEKGYAELLERAGFQAIRVRRVTWALTELLDRVARRMHLLGELGEGETPDPEGAEETLAAARRFVEDGGVGYALVTARR